MPATIYTIGHSTHEAGRLVELLRQHGITAIADVRSRPYSRVNPQFNRESLARTLKDAGISYVFLGKELGARPDDRSSYIDGRVSYERLAASALFRDGIDRVMDGADKFHVALM